MIKYLPGFRSGNKVKLGIALSYYLMTGLTAILAKEIGMFIFYVGLPLAILSLSEYLIKKEKIYKLLAIAGLVMSASGFFMVRTSDTFNQVETTKDVEEKLQDTKAVETKIKNAVGLKFTNLTLERENEALEILSKCGITKIKTVTHDEVLDGDDLYGYRLSTEYDNVADVIVYFDHERIRQVRFLGEYLYKSGEVVSIASDHFLTSSQQSDYQIRCKKVVESILKSPSTAKFPNITKWNVGKIDDKVIVQSYVDSQNSFGAMLRSEFQFIIENDKVTSFIFDGQEMIE